MKKSFITKIGLGLMLLCAVKSAVTAAYVPALIDHIPVGATVQAVTDELIKRMSANRATPEYLKMCLEYGVNPDATFYESSVTLLMHVVGWVQVGLAQVLVEYGAEVDCRDSLGQTALFHIPEIIFEHQKADACALIDLLFERGADINAADNYKHVALHKLIRNPVVIRSLISKNANLNVQEESGHTALMIAVACEEAETVALLLNAGANRFIKNNEEKTPLDVTYDYMSKLPPGRSAERKVLEKIQQLLLT